MNCFDQPPNDPQKAAEAGREGGKNSHGGGRSSDENR
ncbi:general stress protein [Pseudomonas sp. KCJK9111]